MRVLQVFVDLQAPSGGPVPGMPGSMDMRASMYEEWLLRIINFSTFRRWRNKFYNLAEVFKLKPVLKFSLLHFQMLTLWLF